MLAIRIASFLCSGLAATELRSSTLASLVSDLLFWAPLTWAIRNYLRFDFGCYSLIFTCTLEPTTSNDCLPLAIITRLFI